MTEPGNTPNSPAAPLSLFEVYNGYVVTQGRDALENVVMWEKLLRFAAVALAISVAMHWAMSDPAPTPVVLAMKAIVSAMTFGLSGFLLWQARGRVQHELRIDLIHCALSQVIRSGGGSGKEILRVPFDEVDELFIRRNPELPHAAGLYMRLARESEPVLLAAGDATVLAPVHHRICRDLGKARRMRSAPVDLRRSEGRLNGFQTA